MAINMTSTCKACDHQLVVESTDVETFIRFDEEWMRTHNCVPKPKAEKTPQEEVDEAFEALDVATNDYRDALERAAT